MINTPVNQIRLTNVAIVRMKKNGKRFEIACYPNKVSEWKSGVEKDIDNVLQTNTVFENVSKGLRAKGADMEKSFKTTDVDEVCLIILDKGQLQVAGKERAQQQANMLLDIATIVANKCVNPDTQRPYAVSTIEKAMKEAHFSVVPSRSAKQQALEVIHLLKDVIPIERAKMRLLVEVPVKEGKNLKEKLGGIVAEYQEEDYGNVYSFECEVDPGHFRVIEGAVAEVSKGRGRIEVLEFAVSEGGDQALE